MKKKKRIWMSRLIMMGLVLLLVEGCKKQGSSTPPPPPPPPTVTDIDGNVYHLIIIGGKEWMLENLKVTKFNDGSDIPLVTDSTAWSKLTTPAYCWLDNNEAMYKSTYGALYNWYAVNTGKLCPHGFHVASHAEWTEMINFLGGDNVAGGKLKEAGTSHWASPNTDATNESGFTAYPTGGHYFDGTWWHDYGNYWTSTEYSYLPYKAYDINLHDQDGGIYHDQYDKGSGFSVRCIKD